MSRALNRVSRLQRIEESLLASPRGYTSRELAARLGVDRTTIWRDLHELSAEVPIQQDGDRYFIDRQHYLSNVRLSQGESLMLYLAMRHMIRRTTHLSPLMTSALEKLSLVLRHPLASQLAEAIHAAQADHPPDADRLRVWETLIRGWLEQLTVRVDHQKFSSPQANTYEVHPYFFEPAPLSEGVYLIAYSASHGKLRTFKVERILSATLTTESFTRPADMDLDTLLRHAWGIWYGEEPVEVRLRFRHPAARRVQETIWHPLQEVETLPDGSIEWRLRVAGTLELVPWIRGWGPDCEVLAPPELRQQIAGELRHAAAQYTEE